MKLRILAFIALVFSCLITANLVADPSYDALQRVPDQKDQWWLPEFLKEASGIAVMDDQSILVHDDEIAVIYRISPEDGIVETLGWLGSPEFERDLEGIAIDGETVYLVTSEGFVYHAAIDLEARDQTLEFSVFDTGLETICELEGLHIRAGKLLLPCKVPNIDAYKDKLVIFEIDIQTRKLQEHLTLTAESFGMLEGPYPSAIESTATHYYIISTRNLLEVDAETLETSVYSLPKSRHFQPEGIGLLEDGSIVVVEDVRKGGQSRLTHYPGIEALEKIR